MVHASFNDYFHVSIRFVCAEDDSLHSRLFPGMAVLAAAIFLLGTIGNVLCFLTLRGKSFTSSASTRFILSAMLIVDECVLICGLGPLCLKMAFGIYLEHTSRVACPLITFLSFYPRHLSSFMVCLLTVERLMAVYVPLRCKELCSARRVKIVCLAAVVVYLLIDGYHLGANHLMGHFFHICESRLSEAAARKRELIAWLVIDACLGMFVPAALLIVLNALIVHKIAASHRAMKTSRTLNDASSSASNKGASVTVILFVESAVFVVFSVPAEIFYFKLLSEVYSGRTFPFNNCTEVFIYILLSLLAYAGSSFNFAMYMLSGSKFRKAFLDTIFRRTA